MVINPGGSFVMLKLYMGDIFYDFQHFDIKLLKQLAKQGLSKKDNCTLLGRVNFYFIWVIF